MCSISAILVHEIWNTPWHVHATVDTVTIGLDKSLFSASLALNKLLSKPMVTMSTCTARPSPEQLLTYYQYSLTTPYTLFKTTYAAVSNNKVGIMTTISFHRKQSQQTLRDACCEAPSLSEHSSFLVPTWGSTSPHSVNTVVSWQYASMSRLMALESTHHWLDWGE